jgi:hypothetical protein
LLLLVLVLVLARRCLDLDSFIVLRGWLTCEILSKALTVHTWLDVFFGVWLLDVLLFWASCFFAPLAAPAIRFQFFTQN